METTSQPEVVVEEVQDLDIGFSSGYLETLTLRGNDTYTVWPDRICVTKNGESATYFIAHIAYYRERKRIVRTPIALAKAKPGEFVPVRSDEPFPGYGHAV
jgi:hypothetical protein